MIAPLGVVLLWSKLGPAALFVLPLLHLPIVYATLNPSSQWLGPVVTRFPAVTKSVWLTFDDGPHPADTPRILDLLDQHGARATFFVKGTSVEKHPEIARAIMARGHTLGNHSATHPSATFWGLPPRRIASEIDRCSDAIERATGARPTLFRAPVGMKNPFVHPLLDERGMRLIGWSARGYDGVKTAPELAVQRIMRNVEPGTIILAHEGRSTADGTAVNVEMLELLLETLSEKGYVAVIPIRDELMGPGQTAPAL